MINGIIIFILFLLVYNPSKYTISVPKVFKIPKIDGKIEKAEWNYANKISDFIEHYPKEGRKEYYKTIVYLSYDDKNLYIAFICYDDLSEVRRTLVPRDNLVNDDQVGIYIDPLNRKKVSYIIKTNPIGVKFDGIKEAGLRIDYNYDLEFDVKTGIYDSFWVAEFGVPFTSLRYESINDTWRINFIRIRSR